MDFLFVMTGRLFLFLFMIFCFSPVMASEVMDVWRNNRAVDQLDQKKFLQAHESFNRLLGEHTFHSVFRFNLGVSFVGLGEVNKAIKMYRELLKLHPLPPGVEFSSLYNLGVLYSLLLGEDPENLNRALRFYQKALEIRPDSKEIKTNIELLFRGSEGNQGSGKSSQERKNGKKEYESRKKKSFTDKPDEKQGKQQKNKDKKMSEKDVEKILNELKKQEQNIRARHKRKKFREADREKSW